ncbi:hypothetical protein SDC9_101665 [bioreactor metagenome]|jgi:hypothetical protein|uniref:Uncharacterized protein n=1 Tax=bioreactor metagenome TaxID=1076179 RepID=A0A645ANQ4_9ZZZZ
MSDNEKSFPTVGESNWWKLRELFKQKIPVQVTASYLASALTMSEDSARSNIIGPFKKMGLIDENGKPTDLAIDWRDDIKYPSVCKFLFEKMYPQEVRDLFHSINLDIAKLNSWFMNYCRCGEKAAQKFSQLYILLLSGELKKVSDSTTSKKNSSSQKEKTQPRASVKKKQAKQQENQPNNDFKENKDEPSKNHTYFPEIHIDLQLHISPDTPPDQIDKIFESMAKHLRNISGSN